MGNSARTRGCCIVLVLLSWSLLLTSQNTTGDIRGIVRDPSGAVVPGATIEVKNTDQNATVRTLKTGADGSYVAPQLIVGHYQITVTAPGFETLTTSNVMLNVNDRRVIDLQLKLGSSEQTVHVQENPAHIDLDTSQAEGLLSGTQVRELAVLSRNFVQLVALQPGVATDFASDQFYVGASNPLGTSTRSISLSTETVPHRTVG